MIVVITLAGRWRIVETVAWPREHLDLCGLAFLPIDANNTGEMAFGAVTTAVNIGFTTGGLDFHWNGSDEGEPIQAPARQTFGTMAVSKARSPITMASRLPSSPSRGLLQQSAKFPCYITLTLNGLEYISTVLFDFKLVLSMRI